MIKGLNQETINFRINNYIKVFFSIRKYLEGNSRDIYNTFFFKYRTIILYFY